MKIKDLNLEQWQELKTRFVKAHPDVTEPCFRIDGTIMSTAGCFGGFTYNGTIYTVIYFKQDAAGNVPMLGVRREMLNFVNDILKKGIVL